MWLRSSGKYTMTRSKITAVSSHNLQLVPSNLKTLARKTTSLPEPIVCRSSTRPVNVVEDNRLTRFRFILRALKLSQSNLNRSENSRRRSNSGRSRSTISDESFHARPWVEFSFVFLVFLYSLLGPGKVSFSIYSS